MALASTLVSHLVKLGLVTRLTRPSEALEVAVVLRIVLAAGGRSHILAVHSILFLIILMLVLQHAPLVSRQYLERLESLGLLIWSPWRHRT